MSNYFKKDRRNVATIYSRIAGKTEPAEEIIEKLHQALLPRALQFVLPDETVIEVDTSKEISIGRHSRPEDPDVSVDLQNHDGHALGVSRFHAIIRESSGVLTLRDLDSVNGTLVNGMKAIPLQRYPLQDGDQITLGELSITIKFVH